MAAIHAGGQSHHERMFTSIFPAPNYTTPTPEVTPQIGTLASPGQPFGGPSVLPAAVEATVQRALARSTAAKFLSLPLTKSYNVELRSFTVNEDIKNALRLLLSSDQFAGQEDLVDWYKNEIHRHYHHLVLPDMLKLWKLKATSVTASELIGLTTHLLKQSQLFYLWNLKRAASQERSSSPLSKALFAFETTIVRDLHTLTLHSLPNERLLKALSTTLHDEMEYNLGSGNPDVCRAEGVCRCPCSIGHPGIILDQLREVGLGDNLGQRALAHAVHRLLHDPIIHRRCMRVEWVGQWSVVPMLRAWMRDHFASAMADALRELTGSANVSEADIAEWERTAVENLGRSRADYLFDFVKVWPQASGGIHDIKEYLAIPNAKAYVCAAFEAQLAHRILHPGVTTSEILSIYVNVINVFKFLDPRGVLLEKVAVPIKAYLRGRDDTVEIIAQSFLADIDDSGIGVPSEGDKVCGDIAREVTASGGGDLQDHRSLDWNDMNWLPDPIDAGSDWKTSKTNDVIAHVLNLFEPLDFLAAIQKILCDHLLQSSPALEYEKETRLVELFKSRFGQDKLQHCEVMLKDMRDSAVLERKIKGLSERGSGHPTPAEIHEAIPEEGITFAGLYMRFQERMPQERFIAAVKLVAVKRKDLLFPKRMHRRPQRGFWQQAPEFHAQVVSKNFWPAMLETELTLPGPMAALQQKYAEGYEKLKGQQRLRWQHGLGKVTVQLQLLDRTVEETVQPAFAMIISAFQRTDDQINQDETEPLSNTVEELQATLGTEEILVRQALGYWTALRVLTTSDNETYTVLERLPADEAAEPLSAQALDADISATRSQDAVFRSQQTTFKNTIVSMLTNAGAMAPAQILMMLKFALQSFTYGEAELQWLLDQLVAAERVAKNGDVYVIAK